MPERPIEYGFAEGITIAFDKFMCNTIRRLTIRNGWNNPLEAAVTTTFPPWGLVDCLISLDNRERDAEQLATALFNLHVESTGHARYGTLTGGAGLHPTPEVTLKGVLDEAIICECCIEIRTVITACPMCKEELEERSCSMECGLMAPTGGSDDEGATINASNGLE